MSGSIFIKKPLDLLMKEAEETGENSLKRSLGPVSLVSLGVGAIIGAGIFVLTGAAAAKYAGPAIVLSFILAGIGCVFAGLCYAEFASLIPIAGSAYTYGYATLGELFAWIIGWDLILEYAFRCRHRRLRLERIFHQPAAGFRHSPAAVADGHARRGFGSLQRSLAVAQQPYRHAEDRKH